METAIFLKEALPESGSYCVFASNTSADRRSQQFFDSVDDVVDAAQDLDTKGYDVYFALASFKEAKSRKVDNVQHLKSFFLDLDCGPSKDFVSQTEALAQLKMFCKQLQLPRPLLINSGRGIHVYWVLSEAVPLDDWLPVALRLKQLCAENNFLADPAVTADAARVLRIPRTHNYKPEIPAEVDFVGTHLPTLVDFDLFSRLLGNDLIPVPTKRFDGANAVMNAALSNREYRFKDILLKTSQGEGCAQIQKALTNPNGVSEPIWRGMLSVLKACSDGSREKAHKISKGYDGYDPEETDSKWDNLTSDKRYTCVKFEETEPETCLQCPNRGKYRSPLHIGKRVREATEEENTVEAPALDLPNAPVNTYVIPKYPFPYIRGTNGGVYIRSQDSEGNENEERIYHNDIYIVKRIVDLELGESVVVRLHLPKDGVREFTLPLTAVTSKEELRKNMSMHGVAVSRVEKLMEYITTWVNELQEKEVADKAYRQFGWIDDEATGFVLGNQMILKDEVVFNPPSKATAGMFPAFEPQGTLDEWREVINFYNKPGFELHQYATCTGFGSVLMQFIDDIACSALHLYSKESGLGKTTAMKASASIWGDPAELVINEQDTHNTKMNRSEVLHNLPLLIDELTNAKSEALSTLALQFTTGKQRGRLISGGNAERLRGESWSLLALTTGNTSIIERIRMKKENPNAEAQRILEVRVEKMFTGSSSKEETDDFSRALGKCYGHAGPVFVQYVINNLDEVKRLIREIQIRIDKKAGLSSENRFWSVHATLTLAGAIIAKQLGLIRFDIPALTDWTVSMLLENKAKAHDMAVSIEQTLNEYVNEHIDNILRIKSTSDLRKIDGTAMESIILPEAVPRNKLVARYETDIKKLYLVPKPLRLWCGEQQINYGAFINDLVEKLGAKRMKMRLSKGTQLNMPPTDVIAVQFSEGDDEEGSIENI